VIVLRSEELLALVDPGHGAELTDLVHLPTGRQLLGRPPFATALPVGGDLPEDVWTASYRGGWQLAAPNAGAACRVGDSEHGFHGRASNDPWDVVEAAASAATFVWRGHGLVLTRSLELAGATVVVRVSAEAVERAPLVVLEHIALGVELLEPEVEIDLPSGLAYELSEMDGPPSPPAGAPTWPDVLLADGSLERADRWDLELPRSRLLAVAELPEGRARVRNARTGMTVQLRWDAEWLRHLWLWHEARLYGGPWRRQAELLAIEPTSVPHPLGLAAALEHGQALVLAPGETASYELRLTASVT
jgi:galactose mutarotase-like enzyme